MHRPIVDAVTLVERRGVMVLSWQRGLMPDENKRRRRLPWTNGSPQGAFLLGAGVGSLTSAALRAKKIRKLKQLLEAARNNSQTKDEDQRHEPDERKSA